MNIKDIENGIIIKYENGCRIVKIIDSKDKQEKIIKVNENFYQDLIRLKDLYDDNSRWNFKRARDSR